MTRTEKVNGLAFLWENVSILYFLSTQFLHVGRESILKLCITTSDLELEERIWGWSQSHLEESKGRGFPDTVPAISHMYIV